MNIFDGFEQETPEQTASKLGIKKEALEQETKEDILDNINSNDLPFDIMDDNSKWQEITDINDIDKSGVRIIKKNWRVAYKFGPRNKKCIETVIGISPSQDIYLHQSGNDIITINWEDLKEDYYIYIPDLESINSHWQKIDNIDEIGKNSILWDVEDGSPLIVDKEVKSEKNTKTGDMIYYITANNDDIGLQLPEGMIKKDYLILKLKYPNRTYESFFGLKLEDMNNHDLWENPKGHYISKYRLGMRILYKGVCYKVIDVNPDRTIFEAIDGTKLTLTNDDERKRSILKKDNIPGHINIGNDIKNDFAWTTDINPEKDIKRNIRLRSQNDKSDNYLVLDINNGIVTVCTFGKKDQHEIPLSDLLNKFQAYKKDVIPECKRNIRPDLDDCNAFDDNEWEEINDIHKLELGMRLRCKRNKFGRDINYISSIDLQTGTIGTKANYRGNVKHNFPEFKRKFRIYKKDLYGN